MRIVIVGGGLVGSTLSEKLSRDGHDVSVLDVDEGRVRDISDTQDVRALVGNGATARDLRRAGIDEADFVIATTNSDPANMLVGMLSTFVFSVPHLLVRLRDPGHAEGFALIARDHEGERVSVNPNHAAVERIATLLQVPGAVDVVRFMDGDLLVAGFRIRVGSDFLGIQVSDMNLLFAATPTLAVAIHRQDEWIVPQGSERIEEGDLVYFAISREHLGDVLSLVGVATDRRNNVMIAGASPIGRALAKRLHAADVPIVLVEPDSELANAASDELPDTLVLCGHATDPELLEEEGIEGISTFVAVSDDHESNLVGGLQAKRLGAGRAVVLVDNPGLVDLVGQIGIDTIISPRLLVIGLTLQHIRGGRVHSVAQLLEDRIEIDEVEVEEGSRLTRGTLSEIKLPRGVLVAALRRGEKLLVPHGSDSAEPGDRVLLITTTENASKLSDFLAE